MAQICITSEQAKALIAKHGAITMSGIRDLLGLPKDVKKVTRKKPEGKVTEMKLLLRLAGIEFETEYKFHPKRKWRFDICLPKQLIAVEYNGIFSAKSRHTTVTGYSKDREKINAAITLGWRVLEYTPLNYTQVVEDVLNTLRINS